MANKTEARLKCLGSVSERASKLVQDLAAVEMKIGRNLSMGRYLTKDNLAEIEETCEFYLRNIRELTAVNDDESRAEEASQDIGSEFRELSQRVVELESLANEKVAEIQRSKDEELGKMQITLTEFQERADQHQETIGELKITLENVENQRKRISNEFNVVLQSKHALETEYDALQKEKTDADSTISDLSQKIAEIKAEYQTMTGKFMAEASRYQTLGLTFEKCAMKNDELQKLLDAKTFECVELKTNLETSKNEIVALVGQIEQLKANVDERTIRLSDIQSTCRALYEEKDRQQKCEIEELQRKVDKLRSENQEKTHRRLTEIETSTRQMCDELIEKHDAINVELQTQNLTLLSAFNEQSLQLTAKHAEIERLKSALMNETNEKEDFRRRNEDMHAYTIQVAADAQQRCADTDDIYKRTAEENLKLTDAVNDLQRTVSELKQQLVRANVLSQGETNDDDDDRNRLRIDDCSAKNAVVHLYDIFCRMTKRKFDDSAERDAFKRLNLGEMVERVMKLVDDYDNPTTIEDPSNQQEENQQQQQQKVNGGPLTRSRLKRKFLNSSCDSSGDLSPVLSSVNGSQNSGTPECFDPQMTSTVSRVSRNKRTKSRLTNNATTVEDVGAYVTCVEDGSFIKDEDTSSKNITTQIVGISAPGSPEYN